MNDRKEQFRNFSDTRLIEIVKNARQFGYDDTIKSNALEILKERGISQEDLQLTGNLSNSKFDSAEELYKSYTGNSRIAFISYAIFLVLSAVKLFQLVDTNTTLFLIFYLVALVVFWIFLIISFIDQINFYKSTGKEQGAWDQFVFLIIGMPLYIFMYFLYKSQMKEEMKMVQ